jgi:hypothetical protein
LSPEWSPVFDTTWFRLITVVVAVNTIVYALLAMGKLVPRSEQ